MIKTLLKPYFKLRLAALVLVGGGVLLAQVPPAQPIHFDCTSPLSTTLQVKMDLDRNPIESLRMIIAQAMPASTDTTAPVISGISYAGGPSVFSNNQKVTPTANGGQFYVSAGDDVGVHDYSLSIDGGAGGTVSGSAGMKQTYPALFYIRWNDIAVAPGSHTFDLTIWDAAGNSAVANWTMTR